MGSIFVSHSKHDTEMINFFTNITSRLGIQNHFIEWEELGQKNPGIRIRDIITSNWVENVELIVVLLGENLANPPNQHYTQNWVSFEVGVAGGCKKPVLVLEEINHITNYPIPYVTDFYQYQLNNDQDRRDIGLIMQNIVEIWKQNKTAPKEISVQCQHSDCNAQFRLWKKYSKNITCPVCRQN